MDMRNLKNSSTCDSADTQSSTSGSEFGSYCQISEMTTPGIEMILIERQNSKNEEKEGLFKTETLGKQTCNHPVIHVAKQDLSQKCTADFQIVELMEPEYEKIKSNTSVCSSKSDTVSHKSKTKSVKCFCLSCSCTNILSAVISIIISVIISVSIFFLLQDKGVQKETLLGPQLGQSTAEDLRQQSGLSYLLRSQTSRAQLYLDQKALKEQRLLLWTDKDLEDGFMSHDLSTSSINDYGCIGVSIEGIYQIFSKVTLPYKRETKDKLFYHSINLFRDEAIPRELAVNRYTPQPIETRPPTENIYWPSILPGYYHLKPNDRICILVSNITLVYGGSLHNFFSIYKLHE